jgi:hypothetical protein
MYDKRHLVSILVEKNATYLSLSIACSVHGILT